MKVQLFLSWTPQFVTSMWRRTNLRCAFWGKFSPFEQPRLPTHEETQWSNRLLRWSESEKLKASLRESTTVTCKKNAKEGAKTPARLKAHLSGVIPCCVLVSIWSRRGRWFAPARIQSVKKIQTSASEPTGAGRIHLRCLNISLAVHTNALPSFIPVCLRLHDNHSVKNTVTSQTCQINHTCCNVIIYIIILIRKLVTRSGRGPNHQHQVGGGLWGLYRGTLGVLWFSGVYKRCFAALCKGADFSLDW